MPLLLLLANFAPIAVFMAPETALSPQWVDIFSTPSFRKNLVLVAIDEAHCICEWLAVANFISVVDIV